MARRRKTQKPVEPLSDDVQRRLIQDLIAVQELLRESALVCIRELERRKKYPVAAMNERQEAEKKARLMRHCDMLARTERSLAELRAELKELDA